MRGESHSSGEISGPDPPAPGLRGDFGSGSACSRQISARGPLGNLQNPRPPGGFRVRICLLQADFGPWSPLKSSKSPASGGISCPDLPAPGRFLQNPRPPGGFRVRICLLQADFGPWSPLKSSKSPASGGISGPNPPAPGSFRPMEPPEIFKIPGLLGDVGSGSACSRQISAHGAL